MSNMRKWMNIAEGKIDAENKRRWDDAVATAKGISVEKISPPIDWNKKSKINPQLLQLTKVLNSLNAIITSYEDMSRARGMVAVGSGLPDELVGEFTATLKELIAYTKSLSEDWMSDGYDVVIQRIRRVREVIEQFLKDNAASLEKSRHADSPISQVFDIVGKLPAELTKMEHRIENIAKLTD